MDNFVHNFEGKEIICPMICSNQRCAKVASSLISTAVATNGALPLVWAKAILHKIYGAKLGLCIMLNWFVNFMYKKQGVHMM